MLGKCLKHEWIETWIVGAACCAGVLLISILAFFLLPIVPELADSEIGQVMLPILMFTLIIMGFAAICGALFIGRYYFFYRYYKNLFTDQGYLMHTLPVETSDLVNSKLIVALIWQYLLIISYVVAFVFATGGFYRMFAGEYDSYFEFLKEIGENLNLVLDAGRFEVTLGILLVVLYPVTDVLLLFLAVAIGQLGKKSRFILSICALVGISCVKKFAMNILSLISAALSISDMNRSSYDSLIQRYDVMMVLILILEVGCVVGVYILNMHIVKNKLNLE